MSGAKIYFLGGVGSVTGANFMLETSTGRKILVDCGLIQGDRVSMRANYDSFPYDPRDIDALVVTHAHLDHIGRIPKLVGDGFKGTIFSTPETFELSKIVLADAARILNKEAEQEKIQPLYLEEDVGAVLPLWQTLPYHENRQIADGVTLYFKDAGHILGSSMAEITVGSGKILFSGDLGNSPAPLLRDTEPVGDADYIVMESVYGDRNHEDVHERKNHFANIILSAIKRGGTLVIPSFAVDRTQVILAELNDLVESGKIPSIPVFVDSPMAIRATEIYRQSSDLFNEKTRKRIAGGDDIFRFAGLEFVMSNEESHGIENRPNPKIVLAGSGMSMGGRVVSHEERYLPDPANAILLVGYQALGSLGRELADGARKITINRRKIKVRAKVETMYGFSAHRDSDHLVEFVSTGTDRLKQVFVVMGEPGASMHLAQRIGDELGVKATVPEPGKAYDLSL